MRKIDMDKNRKILTLLSENFSQRQVANLTGVGKTTVLRLAEKIKQAKLDYATALKMSDDDLYAALYPPPAETISEPDFAMMNQELGKKNVTMALLYERYVENNRSQKCYTYSSVCRLFNEWKNANGIRDVGGNVERIAGERMEIDFVGDVLEWVGPGAEIFKAKLFVACLPYSNIIYTEAFKDETQTSWVVGIVHALEFFGGAPKTLVMDNAKALVSSIKDREPIFQPLIESLCDYYGMSPWACKPASPKQKNRVEASALQVERWIITQLKLATAGNLPIAADLEDLNKQIRVYLEQINHRPFHSKGLTGCRHSMFESEEKIHLKPLPLLPFVCGDWKLLTVDKSHCVRINEDLGHRYSTPVAYIGQKVPVQVTNDHVLIFDPKSHVCIGKHLRQMNRSGNKTHILHEHLTPAERYHRRNQQDWKEIFCKKGLNERIAEQTSTYYFSQSKLTGNSRCGAVLRLINEFKPLVVNQALADALETQTMKQAEIKSRCEHFSSISQNEGDLPFGTNEQPDCVTIHHENIRNSYE